MGLCLGRLEGLEPSRPNLNKPKYRPFLSYTNSLFLFLRFEQDVYASSTTIAVHLYITSAEGGGIEPLGFTPSTLSRRICPMAVASVSNTKTWYYLCQKQRLVVIHLLALLFPDYIKTFLH